MKVAIYSRGIEEHQHEELENLFEKLQKHNIKYCLYETLSEKYKDIQTFSGGDDLDDSFDFLISLGGDGTLLDCVVLVGNKNIPILGINFGRLGFLAGISKDELEVAVDALINSTYVIDKRTLIHLDADMPLFGSTPFALNDFAIHKRDISPMIKIHTYLNGEFLNTYWADGLIVATPTGSTGYNMSCNGPIVFPEASSFVITPVAPHNLNIRPIVVPDGNIISFEVEGRNDDFICVLDARREIVHKSIQLAIKKESFTVGLIRLNENSFLSTLRNKLTWGLDKRN